jgi:DNA adenine methylase
MSSLPRPFLKWAGSKRALLQHIVPVLPKRFGTYYEPFLGSGSLFFLLQPKDAVISDSCSELVETFRAVRDDVEAVIRYLAEWQPDKETFDLVRAQKTPGKFKRAAQFIYLNKTCWNGLYRVNSAGEFNVPYGRPHANTKVLDKPNLRACSRSLRAESVRIVPGEFESALSDAGRGDLVFLDPPYVTAHDDNGFIDYNETLFSWADQERLAKLAQRLVQKGARVVVTNANHSDVVALYPKFAVRPFTRQSTLAADKTKRGEVREVVLYAGSAPSM